VTRNEVSPAECGPREQVDEKEIILHGRVDLLLKGSAGFCFFLRKISETSCMKPSALLALLPQSSK
jgi:hypothetical protein